MEHLRKAWLPWTAADQFASEEAFGQWLEQRLRVFGNLRLVLLLLASGLLIVGYVLEQRPVMLGCVLPLVLMLVLSLIISKTEDAQKQTNKSQS